MKRILTAGVVASMGAAGLLALPSGDVRAATSTCATPGSGYGELFASLPSATWSTDDLRALSEAMIAPADEPTPPGVDDPEENRAIPAAYTYFGQFVDHDLTLDDRPNDLVTPVAITSLANGRTPQLDLDSLYGAGPIASARLYDADQMHLLSGTPLTGGRDPGATDLPRDTKGQAIIGDPRNDENRIVAGIHSLFIRFHNRTVDRIRARESSLSNAQVFARARREVIDAYQWIVLTDYLPTIVGQRTVDSVIRRQGRGWRTDLAVYDTCAQMPVEFAAAAYRFGHSQVRGFYKINSDTRPLPVFSGTFASGSDLSGFSPSPTTFAIDWNYLLPTRRSDRFQASYKIDASLTSSLSLLPLPTTGVGPANLALRNLLRGQQLGLPTGQDVARALGLTPLADADIRIGAATGDPADQRAITDVAPGFAGKTPLWVYVLAESAAQNVANSGPDAGRLGPVGGRLVAETIVGLLASDPNSIVARWGNRPPVSDLRGLVNAVRQPAADLLRASSASEPRRANG